MRRASIRALAALLLGLGAAAAHADIFSPGELAKPHAALEGLSNCTKCHAAGEQLSPEQCLACHKELQGRIGAGRGLHGRLKAAEKAACQTCHHDHQGRDFKLVEWGAGGQKGFDHARTGFALEGKHKKPECARCHDARHITEPEVKQVMEKGRITFLGTPVACAACHFDEHRTLVGGECQRCHGVEGWKPAARFDHAKATYRLEGKHARVACVKCHGDQQATAVSAAEIGPRTPPVRPAVFARYKGMPFQACTDCHKDPHQARFGPLCASCHTPEDWKKIIGVSKEKAFHEKTRYPLRGGHLLAKCDACHGPWGKEKAKFRGMAFERCTDCHFDAHLGQFAIAPATPAAPVTPAAPATAPVKTCDRCHSLDGYVPARFELEDHARLAYKLEGAHQTVACAGCHPRDPRLEGKVPLLVKVRLETQQRPVKPSLALYKIPRASDCRACHRDPHAGQFQARTDKEGCTGCHVLEAWRKLRFDHGKESRFALAGKHATAACASCHKPEGNAVRYRPLPLTCAGCHADVHAGQLAQAGKGTDCARCHDAASWKEKLRFDHARDSRFKLDGKHLPLACDKCHPVVTIAKGVEARRYRPLPLACEGCHADFHKGGFKGYAP